jgi:tRNA(fMet)-specific endonuclease VapC
MKTILLDTNAYTHLLSGDEAILDTISMAEISYMSIFVLGELHAGFAGGTKAVENREILHDFLMRSTVKILNATAETASVFGFVKNNLRKAGTPIPINDVWIAAHGLESGSTLVTYDAHFEKIPGLRVWGGRP